MKFKSKYGNAIKITNNEVKQRKLKEQGYVEVADKKAAKDKPKTSNDK
jgi:hypothetical protein